MAGAGHVGVGRRGEARGERRDDAQNFADKALSTTQSLVWWTEKLMCKWPEYPLQHLHAQTYNSQITALPLLKQNMTRRDSFAGIAHLPWMRKANGVLGRLVFHVPLNACERLQLG